LSKPDGRDVLAAVGLLGLIAGLAMILPLPWLLVILGAGLTYHAVRR
jgi:hypothetical protein